MLKTRSSGVLLHISSLPSCSGIGDFGPEAHRFVDFLQAAGQRDWQVLPLNPAGGYYSPYDAASVMAGNNNAYCQDNGISWYDWSDIDEDLQNFLIRLIRIRKDGPQFRQTDWPDGSRTSRIRWFTPEGAPLDAHGGEDPEAAPVGALFECADRDDSPACLLLMNPSPQSVAFDLPDTKNDAKWMLHLDTARGAEASGERMAPSADKLSVSAHALQLYIEAR